MSTTPDPTTLTAVVAEAMARFGLRGPAAARSVASRLRSAVASLPTVADSGRDAAARDWIESAADLLDSPESVDIHNTTV